MLSVLKSALSRPGAWLPIAISLSVLGIMLMSFAIIGVPHREPDEGTAAHLFQLWLVLEAVMIASFAVRWLPKDPGWALKIVVLQAVALVAAMAPVRILGL